MRALLQDFREIFLSDQPRHHRETLLRRDGGGPSHQRRHRLRRLFRDRHHRSYRREALQAGPFGGTRPPSRQGRSQERAEKPR